VPAANRKNRDYVEAQRAAAVAAFRDEYGSDLVLAPVLVVIAALDEAESIGEVLGVIPSDVRGVAVDTLVVDDGSVDPTSDVARGYDGVRVARLRRNCGHGIALRLGYQIAYEHGAQFVVTLDADMQWDPRDMPQVLAPLLDGQADFVIGSRVLGSAETEDAFRHIGVRVFAWLISFLTGVTVTDTSSGYRAMRTEVTQTVTQTQVQYQTSELLIGAIYHGYRVTERPITMHKRFAGESKKGHNVLYGLRYAKVIVSTWLRERPGTGRGGGSGP
jgi:glycosyltransferase involved in cell wall biosynthesis